MAHPAQEWLNWDNLLISVSPGKKVSALVTLQTRQGLNVFYDQSCAFRVMDWRIQFGFFILWLLWLSENGSPLATFLNQWETPAQDSISEGFYSLHLTMCLLSKQPILWHPATFLCLADLINRQRVLKRKGTDWKLEAFVCYWAKQLTSVMGLGWTTYCEQKRWNSYIFGQVSLLKKIECLFVGRTPNPRNLPAILWLLDLFLCSEQHTGSLLIGSFPNCFSEAVRVHPSVTVTCRNARAERFPVSKGKNHLLLQEILLSSHVFSKYQLKPVWILLALLILTQCV